MSTFSQAMLLGAWFGVLHAFDADHLATLGGLAVRNRALGACGYALRWAIGHAAAIGLVAAAVLGLGLSSALAVSRYAELAVAAALLAIGVRALLAARGANAEPAGLAHAPEARVHPHFPAPLHAHARRGRASLFMGLLHGGAGSAAVLALAPLARLSSGAASALYLACFSLGVAAGALAFARVFTSLAQRSATGGARVTAGFKAAVGAAALATGGLLLYETLDGGG